MIKNFSDFNKEKWFVIREMLEIHENVYCNIQDIVEILYDKNIEDYCPLDKSSITKGKFYSFKSKSILHCSNKLSEGVIEYGI